MLAMTAYPFDEGGTNNSSNSNPSFADSAAIEDESASDGNQTQLRHKIAIVNPTFTTAAYDNSFYDFFRKYKNTPADATIVDDLNLLSNSVPSTSRQESEVQFLAQHLSKLDSENNVTILTDTDVHNGLIFSRVSHEEAVADRNNDTTNSYGMVILFHNEYVTQQEYLNLKKFVENGGILVAMDGNVLYAEVRLEVGAGVGVGDDAGDRQTISLVKGHGWSFDGKSAQHSISERWANETAHWVGSNYLCSTSCHITFGNNPFDYKHHEEQYITNANITVIRDYSANIQEPSIATFNPRIATYSLNYAQGKVVVMGLYSSDILENKKFLDFFDDIMRNIFG